jgi:hypothetical protein
MLHVIWQYILHGMSHNNYEYAKPIFTCPIRCNSRWTTVANNKHVFLVTHYNIEIQYE